MFEKHPTPYGSYAKICRDAGLWPRPLRYPGIDSRSGKPNGKACKEPNWQLSDHELPSGTIERWDETYQHYNIGLLMGTPLEDGTFLGALDIDHDKYVRLTEVLLDGIVCARIGSKGILVYVRCNILLPNQKFKPRGEANEHLPDVVECLFQKTQTVIPPSTHPLTEQPYQWINSPIYEIDLTTLPLIGE